MRTLNTVPLWMTLTGLSLIALLSACSSTVEPPTPQKQCETFVRTKKPKEPQWQIKVFCGMLDDEEKTTLPKWWEEAYEEGYNL